MQYYEQNIKPLKGNDVMKKILLIHVPSLKENQYYTIDELNNMKNGHPIYYYNVNMKTLKSSILNQLNDTIPVWFGCDYGKFNHRGEALLNNQPFTFKTFPLKKKDLYLKKENSLSYYQTNVNHAMLFTGYRYNTSKQNPHYWIVENSHGMKLKKTSFEQSHGFVTMSDTWFDDYVIMAVINSTYFQGTITPEKKQNAIVLPKWSNLGELLHA